MYTFFFNFCIYICNVRPVVPGGARFAMAPPEVGRSVNPVSTMGGADYAHHITNGTPGFSDLPTDLNVAEMQFYSTNYLKAQSYNQL